MSTPVEGSGPVNLDAGALRSRLAKYQSPAALKLYRVYEQNRQRLSKDDGAIAVKVPDSTATIPQPRGKPRLLLMGQRR